MNGDGMSLRLAFDRDDPEFVLGFELGRAFQVLDSTDGAFECEMHAGNAEMALRLAEATGRDVFCVELDDEWLTVCFSERR